MPAVWIPRAVALGCGMLVIAGACHKRGPEGEPDTGAPATSLDAGGAGALPGASSKGADKAVEAAPRPGMAWIPPGTLRAGTPTDRVPRVADEELPGTEMSLGGFYIDVLPYPNEAGAIATTNVTREDAAHLCEAKGKRLCTEFEWERACKGADNSTYEYGDTYRASACGTGVAIETAARRPSGERVACKSDFGPMDMHGSVWEWTDSPWARGTNPQTSSLGVLRGGNALAGELVGRCANAIGRPVSSKAPTMGFRCCAGPRNPQVNDLVLKPGVSLERNPKLAEVALPPDAGSKEVTALATPEAFKVRQAWTWRPTANTELMIATGCAESSGPTECGVVIWRAPLAEGDRALTLARIASGRLSAEVVINGDARHLRMRGLDVKGSFLREILYAYGRVDVGALKR